MSRIQFSKELEKLHAELLKMGAMTEEAILNSIQSLKEQDIQLAEEIIERDALIDNLELEIEDKCIKLIATQQPLAIDLREICSILRLITDF